MPPNQNWKPASTDELTRAIFERATPLFFGNATQLSPDPMWNSRYFPLLVRMVDVVERVGRSRSLPFRCVRSPHGPTIRADDLGQSISELLSVPAWQLRQTLALYDVDPRIVLFWDEAERRGLTNVWQAQRWTPESHILASTDALNGFVTGVRQRYGRKGFRSKVDLHIQAAHKGFTALKIYLLGVLDCFPRLLPITLDLSYREGAPGGLNESPQSLKITSAHIKSLAAHVRKVYGDAVVGSAWSQDAMVGTGHVVHLLLLLNDVDDNEAFALPREVGRSWVQEITGGEGCFYENLGAQDPRFSFRGLTPEDRRYNPVSEQIRRSAIYMRSTDRFVALKRLPSVQAHGMGGSPARRKAPPPTTQFPFPQVAGSSPWAGFL